MVLFKDSAVPLHESSLVTCQSVWQQNVERFGSLRVDWVLQVGKQLLMKQKVVVASYNYKGAWVTNAHRMS